MEAMSAGLACVHPNNGALYETAAGWTLMYQWHDDPHAHAAVFYRTVMTAIHVLRAGDAELLRMLAAWMTGKELHGEWALAVGRRTLNSP